MQRYLVLILGLLVALSQTASCIPTLVVAAAVKSHRDRQGLCDPASLEKIVIGETREAEVLELLGQPWRTSADYQGAKQLVYRLDKQRETKEGTEVRTEFVTITFQKDGKVERVDRAAG
ncbi:MAG: outer membrane protein assembly factor BamE [Deltaproteobacteria bacterium]|nr:outer membrane protein assembly factor BamE [Deltaproteobacteria bacterium]